MSVSGEPVQDIDVSNVLLIERRPWGRIIGTIAVFVVLAGILGLYYKRTYTGLIDPAAMDVAQVARNVAEGRGFTTRFIRPFNIGLISVQNATAIPELNNAPLYPHIMGAFFKLRGVSDETAVWPALLCMFFTTLAVYVLGRLMFGWEAGLLGASLFGISSVLLSITVTGQGWTLAALLFTVLLCMVAAHHRAASASKKLRTILFAGACGLLVALLHSTYTVFWVLGIPLAVYFLLTGPYRRLNLVVFVVIGLLACAPAVVRNMQLTGSPLMGINAWDIMADTQTFPGETFYRSTDPQNRPFMRALLFPMEHFDAFAHKLVKRSGEFLQAMAPMLGLLALPFAVVSVLYKFKSPAANAVRGLMYGVVPLLVMTFALFSIDKSAVIIFAPVAAVLAAEYFLLLLKAKKLHPVYMRALIGALVLITALPALAAIIWGAAPQRSDGIARADKIFSNLGGEAAVYTDLPWCYAWRTQGTAIWLPMSDEDVHELSYEVFPMRTIMLTEQSESYSTDEVWFWLRSVRLWRVYVRDPEEGLQQILNAGILNFYTLPKGVDPEEKLRVDLAAHSRKFKVHQTIKGLKQQANFDYPMSPEYVLVFVNENE